MPAPASGVDNCRLRPPMFTAVAGPSLLSAFLHMLAPHRCAGCDVPLVLGVTAFCDACAPLLEPAPAARQPPSAAASVFVYGGPLADAIARCKYGARSELASGLAPPLAAAALVFAGTVDCVVPLPLHPSKLRERGFNQSALLARPVARALGVPLDIASLVRVRPTRDQASLPREQRLQNVRGAFAARRSLAGRRVLLIDDVRTTGATLAEAADALRRSGCAEVKTLTLAYAER